MGKILAVLGIVIVILGFLLAIGVPLPILPGDIYYHKGNFTLYIPIVSSIIVSIILTIIFWIM